MGPKTVKARARDADAFLREYTAWANGDGLFFSSSDPDDPDSDGSCGGFLDRDHLLEHEVAPLVKGKEFVIVNESGERCPSMESLVVEFNGGDCTPAP